ncbi:hypothetical protein SAMN04487996_105261 [Dyadobacter soli]|uniref:Uncharacterized protein n=1 Tax=Dyadobacter soli TaxID=659014 RepID=A0A1G7DJR9_9BACT|nr:hypothetical protein [Dyadobacter soli]SDE51778.1 hypothetical protein SAMN04487996_105261 [Dyadobacter soli]
MPSRRGKKNKFKKVLIPVVKWASAIIPVCAFIYILYYYKQFDFLKKRDEVKSQTEVLSSGDSLQEGIGRSEALAAKIHITNNEWHQVGGLAIHNMVIENASATTVKNVEVEFKYLNDVQAVVTSKVITIKTPLPAKKSTKISGLSVGYVNNSVVGCDVKVLSVKM